MKIEVVLKSGSNFSGVLCYDAETKKDVTACVAEVTIYPGYSNATIYVENDKGHKYLDKSGKAVTAVVPVAKISGAWEHDKNLKSGL